MFWKITNEKVPNDGQIWLVEFKKWRKFKEDELPIIIFHKGLN